MTAAAGDIEKLLDIMRRLRGPTGCPWDREQTLTSLKTYLIEEVYEVLEAIDSGDRQSLREELGDVLLQVVFQAQLCAEEASFDFRDVVQTLNDKLIRRHPHVFGDTPLSDTAAVLSNWEKIKASEKEGQDTSVVGRIPRHLPALHRAHQVQRKVARVGFDWHEIDAVMAKVAEEWGEVQEAVKAGDQSQVHAELGDLLFSVVNLSRFLGHDPEEALHATIARFIRRFRLVEKQVRDSQKPWDKHSLEELEKFWQAAKNATDNRHDS